jgi:DNA replication and repair protein RecF
MRRREIEARRTLVGPHRDDWGMTLDGMEIRSFGSRGEVRSAMFALHLARFHVLTQKRGISPVVLIDDVMSELDSTRRIRVLELLPPGQVFLTSCDPPPELRRFCDGELAHFEMDEGRAIRIA